jgi:CHAT domain-containing protein
MKPQLLAAFAIVAAGLWLASPLHTVAEPAGLDFALGQNTEAQLCRAVARFDAPRGAKAADIYCGTWPRPSGRVTVFADEASAASALAAACKGDETALQSAEFSDLRQVACARTDKGAIRRYALVARRAGKVVIGEVYPSDWAPLVNAARVMTGAMKAAAVTSAAGETPGLTEIEAVFPGGPPGQDAAGKYELLRLRAYEYNSMWQFDASQRDFEALLAAQQAIAPDDTDSEAEIRAEIGLDLSSSRRFDEARASFDRAEALARAADDALLLSKIENYRAMDQLNQRRFNTALALALAANRSRASLAHGQGAGADITAGDVARTESHGVSRRTLLVSLGQMSPADRAIILNAQADYIAGVAARSLGLASAAANDLSAAAAAISQVGSPPPRLVGDIVDERANLSLASGDYAAAAAAAKDGLTTISTVAPGTRSEAHLWLALETAQAAMGDEGGALASGRHAVDIYANQTESPGMPPDVAAPRLALLEQAWRRTGDDALAAEYFRTLSLVWDGAAARTTALLAARIAEHDAADQMRAYQDAERGYRAAFARRQVLLGDPDAPPGQIASANDAVNKAVTALGNAEADLRARAPAYLELLDPQASAADLEAVLAAHEAYLRVVMTGQGGFGVLVDGSGVHPFRTTLTSAQADGLVDGVRRSTHLRGARLPDYDIDAAVKLYASLIGPVQDRLQDVRDLDVDVSGSLASIPFAALVATPPSPDQMAKIRSDADYSGVDWAARRFTIVNALGPASFIRLRKQPPPAPAAQLGAVAYGDFEPDPQGVAARVASTYGLSEACKAEMAHSLSLFPALPDTAGEARSVASSFSNARVSLGKDFTDAAFLHDPATAKADVILVATHGVLAISPCFPQPALLTSLGASGTGLIEASALLDEQLSARLVLLSACDTAAGGKLDEALTGLDDGGDALSGLARAFIYAGARDVLASEWMVDADSSKTEIAVLLKEASAGKSVRAALSDAEAAVYTQAETAHPFYWAPFILVGDGAGTLGAPPAQVATLESATR